MNAPWSGAICIAEIAPIAAVSACDAREHVVLAGPVGDHVVVQLVGERRELAQRSLRPRAAARPHEAPTSPPTSPAQGRRSPRPAAAAGAPRRRPRSAAGRTRRSGRRATRCRASPPRRRARRARSRCRRRRSGSRRRTTSRARRRRASRARPQPSTSSASAPGRCDARSRAGRSPSRGRRRTGSRRRRRRTGPRGSATTPSRPGRRSPRGRGRRQVDGALDDQEDRRDDDRGDVTTGRAVRSIRRRGAAGRSAALRRRRAARVLADPDLVADPLELRRPLAQPRAAVGALGDVRAHLGAAALADDGELGAGHATTESKWPSGVCSPSAISATSPTRSSVRSIHRELAVGARAVVSRSSIPSSSSEQPSSLGVRAEPPDEAARHLGGGHLLAGAEIDQLARRSRARGADLVVVDQLGRVLDQRLLGVVGVAEPVGEADVERSQRDRVLDVVCWSKTRVSTVPRFGCGRTSHHRNV